MQKPSVGSFVHVRGTAVERNGTDVAPAVITRVWNDELVNLTAFPDEGSPLRLTSVRLAESADAATPEQCPTLAYWPPRV